jgi:putative hydrolase of the HAD superfamily
MHGFHQAHRAVEPLDVLLSRLPEGMSMALHVIFDLDDTLYPERQYALGGFAAVGAWAEREFGAPGIAARLTQLLDLGHLGAAFRMALAEQIPDFNDTHLRTAMKAYADHTPALTMFDDAAAALEYWAGTSLGLITDGNPKTQASKVSALGLTPRFAKIVLTGALAPKGEMHKPHRRAYEIIEATQRKSADDHFVYIGDNPKKDFLAPNAMGWTTVLVDRPAARATRIHPLSLAPDGGEPQHTIESLDLLPRLLGK